MDFTDIIKQEQVRQQKRLTFHKEMLADLQGDSARLACCRRPDGIESYYITEDGRRTYANKVMMPRVNKLKLREYLKKEIKHLERNQCLFAELLKSYKEISYTAVDSELPKSYRGAFVPASESYYIKKIPPFTPSENPFYAEELRHTASFGLKVRTKGEMIIAELLYSLGIPFCYEKEVFVYDEDGHLKAVYPDFSILIGNEWFYIEHLGRLDLERYRQRNAAKLHDYHINGILMPGQLIFTMDGPDGELDAGPIRNFLEQVILPRILQAEPAG